MTTYGKNQKIYQGAVIRAELQNQYDTLRSQETYDYDLAGRVQDRDYTVARRQADFDYDLESRTEAHRISTEKYQYSVDKAKATQSDAEIANAALRDYDQKKSATAKSIAGIDVDKAGVNLTETGQNLKKLDLKAYVANRAYEKSKNVLDALAVQTQQVMQSMATVSMEAHLAAQEAKVKHSTAQGKVGAKAGFMGGGGTATRMKLAAMFAEGSELSGLSLRKEMKLRTEQLKVAAIEVQQVEAKLDINVAKAGVAMAKTDLVVGELDQQTAQLNVDRAKVVEEDAGIVRERIDPTYVAPAGEPGEFIDKEFIETPELIDKPHTDPFYMKALAPDKTMAEWSSGFTLPSDDMADSDVSEYVYSVGDYAETGASSESTTSVDTTDEEEEVSTDTTQTTATPDGDRN